MKFSKEEKAMWITDWRESGKTAWSYAKENGLIPQTFVGWVKKEDTAVASFVEVPREKILLPVQPHDIIVKRGELRIHVPLGLSEKELHTIFTALGWNK